MMCSKGGMYINNALLNVDGGRLMVSGRAARRRVNADGCCDTDGGDQRWDQDAGGDILVLGRMHDLPKQFEFRARLNVVR